MKTIIENSVQSAKLLRLFNAVVDCCTKASDEEDLRERLTVLNKPKKSSNYHYGFGRHHFWFAEWNGQEWNRLIIVEF